MTGEVKLLNELKKSLASFSELRIGEGVVNKGGVRIKVKHNTYLHFATSGVVFSNSRTNWPSEVNGEIRRFRLIAEEI